MTNEDFKATMKAHNLFRRHVPIGQRAVFRNDDLDGLPIAGVVFTDCDLRGASLACSNARHAVWSGADLRGADLLYTEFAGSNLRCADLRGADMRNVDLRNADLSGADIRGADLSGADIRGANFSGADLRGATMKRAWKDADTNLNAQTAGATINFFQEEQA